MGFAEDLDAMYADSGEPVVRQDGGAGFYGFVDLVPGDAVMGQIAARRTLRFVTGRAADLVEGDVLTIDGASYALGEDPEAINLEESTAPLVTP